MIDANLLFGLYTAVWKSHKSKLTAVSAADESTIKAAIYAAVCPAFNTAIFSAIVSTLVESYHAHNTG